MTIPISRPIIGDAEIDAVGEVLRSGMLASGRRVAQFEEAFAASCGAEHAVAVGSGTAALHVGLMAAGVGPGDEVIVPSFSFAATANVVRLVGAEPVFVDVDTETYCITGAGVEAVISPHTAGVMPVHLYGHPAAMADIEAVAEMAGIAVFEDAAQAHGASLDGRPVGSFGRFAGFSFYPTKNMTTGEGGMITTSDADLARRARLIRNQGMQARYVHQTVGMNERMTEIEGAIGLIQLGHLERWTAARRANAEYYRSHLNPELRLPGEADGAFHVYHQFTIRPDDRPAVIAALEAAGIGYGIYYPRPIHLQPPYADATVSLPTSEMLANHVLSIPVRPDLTAEEREKIVVTLNGAVG